MSRRSAEFVTAYLGLGSNQGDRERQLRAALERLEATPGVRVAAVSSLRETAPLGEGPEQPPFLNGAARVETSLSPSALLDLCKALEAEAGRVLPAPRDHPRPLDLDLLLWGEETVDLPDLQVPHPRLLERDFVREPLRELGVDIASVPVPERPVILPEPQAFAARCRRWQARGFTVGIVPTMGALHSGHESLMHRALRENGKVVVTVFVNPLQFGPSEDLEAYPRRLERDVEWCRNAGVHAVFAPSPEAMYPDGFCTRVRVGSEAEGMEGARRPGHFEGVATVVARLLSLSWPHRAYFGEKDAQQLAVIRRLVADLGLPTEVVACPTVREADGLALSSRNAYLGPGDRRAASVLYRALSAARERFRVGERDPETILGAAREVLRSEPRVELDYLELRREGDLQPPPAGPIHEGRLLIAARVSGDSERPVRLIDNLSLAAPPDAGG